MKTIKIIKDTSKNLVGDILSIEEFRSTYPEICHRFPSDDMLWHHLLTWKTLNDAPGHPENAGDWFELEE